MAPSACRVGWLCPSYPRSHSPRPSPVPAQCVAGYRGVNCSEEINECLSHPCQNGGTCIDLINTYKCSCPRGTQGKGWPPLGLEPRGKWASQTPGQRRPRPKQSLRHASWGQREGVGLAGEGPKGGRGSLAGPWRELQAWCMAACHQHPAPPEHLCSPVRKVAGLLCGQHGPLWHRVPAGVRCEIDVDDCDPPIDPVSRGPRCFNSGTCVDQLGGYSCACPPGFVGERCEGDVNECLSNPCDARGTQSCVQRVNDFHCECRAGHTGRCGGSGELGCQGGGVRSGQVSPSHPCSSPGRRCESVINGCKDRPCRNGGTCAVASNTARGFICKCPAVGAPSPAQPRGTLV